jgi:hypothetical protein
MGRWYHDYLQNDCGLQSDSLECTSKRCSIGNPVGHSVEITYIGSNAAPDASAIARAVNPAHDVDANDALTDNLSSHYHAVHYTHRSCALQHSHSVSNCHSDSDADGSAHNFENSYAKVRHGRSSFSCSG